MDKAFKIRKDACKLAAATFRNNVSNEGYSPYLWSLCVFYESYLLKGSSGTLKNFGPKKPKKLKVIKNG